MTGDARAVRLVAVGDLQLGDSATCVGFGFRAKVTDDHLLGALRRFAAIVGPSDLTFGNLETPLSDVGLDRHNRRSRQLRGAPSYAAALRDGGFTVLNVANNHALEHGTEAFLDSTSRLKGLGIAICGLRGTDGWASQPVTQVAKGLRVGFLGYSLRPGPEAIGEHPHAEPSEAEILADVATASA